MKKWFFEHLCTLARTDERIFLLVGDIGFNAIEGFASEFPDRFLNVGVAEQNMATIAAGLAKKGFRPFIYSIANFPLLRAFEQVRNDIVHERLPVTIVSVGTGFDYGNLGYSHHALEDVGVAMVLSGLEIFSPANEQELEACTRKVLDSGTPSYLKISKENIGITPKIEAGSDLGLYEVTSGIDSALCLVSYGHMVQELMTAAEILSARYGVEARVFSAPNLRMESHHVINSGSSVFLIEEQVQGGGIMPAAYKVFSDAGLMQRICHIGVRNPHSLHNGNPQEIREAHGLDAESIAARVYESIGEI